MSPRKLMSLISFLRNISFLGKNSATRKVTHKTFPVVSEVTLEISQSPDKRIPVTGNFLRHLKWWEEQENLMAGAPIHPHVHNTLVFRDASQKAWGAHLNEIVLSGLWSNKEARLHINVLELKAVLLGLKGLQEHLQGQRVLICSDNSTVVSYLNKEGGTHSIEMENSGIHKFQKDPDKNKTCTWIPKCDSRLPITKGQGHTDRVVSSPTDI